MDPSSTAYLIGTAIGGLLAGAVCGLLPRHLARKRGRETSALFGLLASSFAGLLGGAIVAVPVALFLSAWFLTLKHAERVPADRAGP